MKPLLVGEANPYGSDPRYALYPYPENSAGGRLCRKVLGLEPREYLARFERVNLMLTTGGCINPACMQSLSGYYVDGKKVAPLSDGALFGCGRVSEGEKMNRCNTCAYFTIGTDSGSTGRDGKTFGLCKRSGRGGSMTQPVRWDTPAGLLGHVGPLGSRTDGRPHTPEEIAAHEELKPVYGTAYHDRTTLYVLPEFYCIEHQSRKR